ncbi:DUF3558 family protein [Nocardia sp. SSK8]|uniref:DUF3558 family protein n=1 Tax=Nocardia sp. SSK8 TaxID=3120154 RepID=UPI00300A8E73
MVRPAPALYTFVVAMSVAGFVMGCSSGESSSDTTPSTSVAVEGEPVSAIPAVFEGLDPCALVSVEEAREATGSSSIGAPRRIVAGGQSGSMVACSWRPGNDLGIQLSFTAPPTSPASDLDQVWTDELGHPARVNTISGACHAYVWYGDDRMVDLKIYPPAEQRSSSLEDDVCARQKGFLEQVFAKVPWN